MSYSNRYAHLLDPVILPNGRMLKNRMMSGCSNNNFVMGSVQPYPTDEYITYYANRAKNGASLLIMTGMGDKYFKEFYEDYANPAEKFKKISAGYKQHNYNVGDVFNFMDVTDTKYHCMWTKMTREIHLHQSVVINQVLPCTPKGYDISTGISNHYFYQNEMREEMSKEMLKEVQDEMVRWALAEKAVGFDGIEILTGLNWGISGRMLSPSINRRTDEYGGSLENRARWTIEMLQKIKKACGRDFIIMVRMGAGSDDPEFPSREDMLGFAKMLEGTADIISIFHPGIKMDLTHPSSYDPDNKYPVIPVVEQFKKAGINIPIAAAGGGFCDPADMEYFIEQGKFDLFDMARPWIAEPQYGKLIKEGRGEDIVPCLRCNKCHGASMLTTDVMCSTNCAVNPVWGIENRIDRLTTEPDSVKNVGIVGGGPAGMRAALYAAERGHKVTIYEQSSALGGLLKCVDDMDFKWTLTRYKDWLIRQVGKHPNITVQLNTKASKELLRAAGHDTVIAAIGAKPSTAPIPGIENAQDCYSFMLEKKEAGKEVVIIGGGDVGVDCGMGLAKKGHNVTVLEMGGVLAASSVIMHHYSHVVRAMKSLPNFHGFTRVNTTKITKDSVEYIDAEGKTHVVKADTVLYATGLKPRHADVLALSDSSSYEFAFIGDAKKPSDLVEHNRDAFGVTATL